MKDTDELVTPYESVFLEMEEFHRAVRKSRRRKRADIYKTVFGTPFITFHSSLAKGIPTTCTLN